MTDTPEVDITDVLKLAISRGERADGYARIGVVGAERALSEITRLRRELEAAREVNASALDWFEAHRIELQKVGPGTIPTWVMDGWHVRRAALGEGQK